MSYDDMSGAQSRGPSFFGAVFGGGVPSWLQPLASWVDSLVLLGGRLWLAYPFFIAGRARLNDWGSQEFYFSDIHPVPFLDPGIAAIVTTTGELSLSILLAVGLFGRFAGAGLAIMAATIFFIVGATPEGMASGIRVAHEQIPWMVVGLLLFRLGPGMISVDYLIRSKLLGRP